MNINKIPIGEAPPWDINVIIEVPFGREPVKYEMDKESGALYVDRVMHTSMRYPCNYGFVPHTLSEDGDPIDTARRAQAIDRRVLFIGAGIAIGGHHHQQRRAIMPGDFHFRQAPFGGGEQQFQ